MESDRMTGWKLPADYTRCLGVLDDHSADQSCPRRHECARFVHQRDVAEFHSVSWALCDAAHDFFIRKYDDGE